MSLLKQGGAFKTSDFLFLSLGIAGFLLFFLTYGSHDPRSAIDTTMDLESDLSVSIQVLDSLGYEAGDYASVSEFRSNRRLLDTLQHRLGRRNLIKSISDSTYPDIHPYYWESRFVKEGGSADRADSELEEALSGKREIALRLDGKGRWIELVNKDQVFPSNNVNRAALIYAFRSDSTLQLWKSVSDTTWNQILSFNMDSGYEAENMDDADRAAGKPMPPHEYSGEELRRLGHYYLEKSGWRADMMQLQDIQVKPVRSRIAAELKYTRKQQVFGQPVTLNMMLLPEGSLISMEADYTRIKEREGLPGTLELAHIFAIFLIGIGAMVLFYLRMRARVIDTRPALVVSIIAGLIVPATIFLEEVGNTTFFTGNPGGIHFLQLALRMGFTGAFSSVGFFIAFALGDSITRQHWPEKLNAYDYLRQGMFFNKPVGETLVRSGILAGILCGLWSITLFFFPNLFFEISDPFLHYKATWTPLYLLLDNAWFSLLMVVLIFLVIGSQIYARTDNRWLAAVGMVLAAGLMKPAMQEFGPAGPEFVLFSLLGAGLSYIFLKWDFLTLLLTHFLFLGFLQTSGGWIVEGSPDVYVFGIFCFFILALMGAGAMFIGMGREQHALPAYVPEYVEELAQEERIKQELQIARQVQQSFLPVRTPELKGLDIAALCQPAFETGGDYYDFIPLDDHRIALAVGDVSGKGVPAAFYMTFTKGILHSLCRETDSPAELLKKANRLFVDNARKGTFISLVYGIIDMKEMTFTFSRAGHNPVIHFDARREEVTELQPGGLGIGLTREAYFDNNIKEVKLPLSSGDILMLYTDGIVEALSSNRQFYGSDRLTAVLKEHRHRTSKEILTKLSDDVVDFIGTAKQHDDMTIMVIKLNKH